MILLCFFLFQYFRGENLRSPVVVVINSLHNHSLFQVIYRLKLLHGLLEISLVENDYFNFVFQKIIPKNQKYGQFLNEE